MPYFVFKVDAKQEAELLDTFDDYKQAKALCREHRAGQKPGDSVSVRMVFAKDRKEARTLLTTKRGPSSPVEEWES